MLIGAIAPTLSGGVSSGCLPLGAMALSAYLRAQGIPCRVISTAFPDAAQAIRAALPEADLVGISSMTGHYLRYAIAVARKIKKERPELPVVWGGAHASLCDQELMRHDFVDFVIRGPGEKALRDLAHALASRSSVASIPGLTWKENAIIHVNPADPDFNIEELPPLDYSWLPGDISFLRDEFSYFTSRGCPHRCSYCVSSQLYHRLWYDKSVDKVVSELAEAYARYHFQSVYFWDDNVMVKISRLIDILAELARRGVRFRWSGFCRADLFARLSDTSIETLKDYGLAWLSIGAESGSQNTLDALDKGIRVDDIRVSARKLAHWDIPCDFSLMGGIPGENEADFRETLELGQWLYSTYRRASVRLFRFIPYPKMPILSRHPELDPVLPKDLYGWSDLLYQNARFPWVPPSVSRALDCLAPASLYSQRPTGRSLGDLGIGLLYYVARARWATKIFALPWEGRAVETAYRRLMMSKLSRFERALESH